MLEYKILIYIFLIYINLLGFCTWPFYRRSASTLVYNEISAFLHTKLMILNEKTQKRPHLIFKIGWEIIKKNLKKHNFLYVKIIISYVVIIFLLFIPIFISAANTFHFIFGNEIENKLLIEVLFFVFLQLLTLICIFCYGFNIYKRNKRIKEINSIIDQWNYLKDSFCFDKEYVSNHKWILDSFTEELKNKKHKFKNKKPLFSITNLREINARITNRWECLIVSYVYIWGIHLDSELGLMNNYENIYQDFTNRFDREIKELKSNDNILESLEVKS